MRTSTQRLWNITIVGLKAISRNKLRSFLTMLGIVIGVGCVIAVVAIARALVTNPAILLADEPTGNLESRTSEEIMGIFQQLNDNGKTVVLITHEPDIAQYAKRVVHVRDGLIQNDERVAQKRVALRGIEAPVQSAPVEAR